MVARRIPEFILQKICKNFINSPSDSNKSGRSNGSIESTTYPTPGEESDLKRILQMKTQVQTHAWDDFTTNLGF